MSNFVEDATSLPYPKSGAGIPAIGTTDGFSGADWNLVCQAAVDLRTALLALRAGDVATTTLGLVTSGVVGLETNPQFQWRIQNAGINEPELALFYSDSDETERKLSGTESTGTTASVRYNRGSHFEGFIHDGDYAPAFRLNTSPTMRIEMGPGGSKCAVGGLVRTSNVVTATTTEAHGLGTGQTVYLNPGEPGFASTSYTVASTPSETTFTFALSGADGASTGVQYLSTLPDVAITREGPLQIGMIVGGNRKFSIYADSMVTEDGIRLVSNGTLEAAKITATTTTPYALGNEYGVLVNATAGAKTVNLPAANSCKGRKYLVKKTDAGVNGVVVTRAGSDTIEGSTTKTLATQYAGLCLVSDGTATWFIESSLGTVT